MTADSLLPPPLNQSLPGHYYHAVEIYQRELNSIFSTTWLCAGRGDAIAEPGMFFVRQVGPESILVTRDNTGRVAAFYNVCRHRGARLCTGTQGKFRGNVITCRYHQWSYGLDGALLATPNLSRQELELDDYPLQSVGVREYAGLVYINLSSPEEAFLEPLGGFEEQAKPYRLEQLRVGHSLSYEVGSNWKIIVENFMECYHCPSVHPELCRMVPEFRKAMMAQGLSNGARLAPGATTLTKSGTSNRPAIGELTGGDIGVYRSKVRYPNLFLSFHSDYVLTHTLWPSAPDRTTVICDWLFAGSAIEQPDFDPMDAVEMWDIVNREDWEMCELAQQGVASRSYRHGVYGSREHLLHHFNEFVRERLGAD